MSALPSRNSSSRRNTYITTQLKAIVEMSPVPMQLYDAPQSTLRGGPLPYVVLEKSPFLFLLNHSTVLVTDPLCPVVNEAFLIQKVLSIHFYKCFISIMCFLANPLNVHFSNINTTHKFDPPNLLPPHYN